MSDLEKIKTKSFKAIDENLFPGCIIGYLCEGKREVLHFGNITYDSNSPKVSMDTIYDVASITKSIPTACLGLKLMELGLLNIDDKVIEYIPELSNKYRENILVRHLLAQGLDCGYRLSDYKHKSPDEILKKIYTGDYNNPPGKKHFSTNTSSILLSILLNRITGKTLEELAKNYYFNDLNMFNSSFFPEKSKNIVAPTQYDEWRGRIIQGEIHDETAYKLKSKIIVGSSGLFSTVPDLLNFAQMLIDNGSFKGKKIFLQTTIELMMENQFGKGELPASLGWDLSRKAYMGELSNSNTFGKTGFTGCSFICNPRKKISIVILSNYHFPNRKSSFVEINQFRKDISNAVFS